MNLGTLDLSTLPPAVVVAFVVVVLVCHVLPDAIRIAPRPVPSASAGTGSTPASSPLPSGVVNSAPME